MNSVKLLRLWFIVVSISGFAAIFIYITGSSSFSDRINLSEEDLNALISLKNDFQKCVMANGLGLQASSGRYYCNVTIDFPKDTIRKWNPETGKLEELSYEFDLCEALATWEQPRLDSIEIVAISHSCTGVEARACGLVGLEPTRVAEILKDRPSWFCDCGAVDVVNVLPTPSSICVLLV
ncbi:hypothetical protein MKX03_036793 [Papaver bracteatum]|nr:hypothetical protein MKX03_036793 [Papaver bracteatum]